MMILHLLLGPQTREISRAPLQPWEGVNSMGTSPHFTSLFPPHLSIPSAMPALHSNLQPPPPPRLSSQIPAYLSLPLLPIFHSMLPESFPKG